MQFHVIELEKFLADQTIVRKSTQHNINFLESIVVRLQRLAAKSKITKVDIEGLIKAHQLKVSMGKKDLEAVLIKQRSATAQISDHTNNNSNIRRNISASAAFRSIVDDLDVIVHALQESLAPPTLHAQDNARLRSILVSKEAEISLLQQEIAELKVCSYGLAICL
ncbi:uncharacterized protein GLRG_09798 [Colletotrichum graminicola M1.001]|uniref:Uncharacterized protein n=1 Tax=Colletotrichum graminicola (strain M1.001 / M2 / FGSC 10212) TaxID=645133 RepID=E3QUW6_COLGM|nr:uncharacterized protein GLRG_09798 [Colletotrichum graminicola M1.001]EFQ34654.1 hypothetical protein GLRG_09798 [Colletotrichum graminicola M1.001]